MQIIVNMQLLSTLQLLFIVNSTIIVNIVIISMLCYSHMKEHLYQILMKNQSNHQSHNSKLDFLYKLAN